MIDSALAISLVDLCYKTHELYHMKWHIPKTDLQKFKQILHTTCKYLRIEEIENYDSLNLLQVNIVRALIKDPEDCIVQLTWIRLQHVMALSDKDWQPCEWLAESTSDALKGCIKFLHEKSQERRNELRLSRQASFMT